MFQRLDIRYETSKFGGVQMGTEQDIQDQISLYFTGTFLIECRNGIMYFEGGFRVLLDGFRHIR